MGDCSILEGTIVHQSDIGVNEQVGVDRASLIMAREDGLESGDSLIVGDLDSTKESAIISDFVACSDDTRVVTSGITVPDVDVEVFHGETGVDVEVLDFKVERDTGLAFCDILAN